jgi:6-phosphogluconolactonase
MRRILLAAGLLAAFGFATTAASSSPSFAGSVYALTNSPGGNAVLAYGRAADGTLAFRNAYPTGGNGTGGGLGSQGALVLSDNGHWLVAVNAGSDSISLFAVRPDGLELAGTAPSGGSSPISVTVHDKVVYVLDAGGSGNIAGFTIEHGSLTPLAGSNQPLGVGAAAPAEVAFAPDGRTLVVTEKNSNSLDTYAVGDDGVASAPAAFRSVGATPFGFDFDNHGDALVSNASGSASSYAVDHGGRLAVVTGALATGQAAPCWLVAGKDGRYAYAANGGSGTITGFSVGRDGSLALLGPSGVSADLGAGSHPLDEAVTGDGRFLYNLTDGQHKLSGFWIADDGSLTSAGSIGGLPAGAAGIAAS